MQSVSIDDGLVIPTNPAEEIVVLRKTIAASKLAMEQIRRAITNVEGRLHEIESCSSASSISVVRTQPSTRTQARRD